MTYCTQYLRVGPTLFQGVRLEKHAYSLRILSQPVGSLSEPQLGERPRRGRRLPSGHVAPDDCNRAVPLRPVRPATIPSLPVRRV